MRKNLAIVISVLLIIGTACGCGSSSGTSAQNKQQYQSEIESQNGFYPLYESLYGEKKQLYIDICSTIKNYSKNSIELGEYETERDARTASKEMGTFYRNILFENPEYFWVDPYTFTINEIQSSGKYRLTLSPKYIVDEDVLQEKKSAFDQKVTEIVYTAKTKTTDFDKVLFVYDYILANSEYDYELIDSGDTTDLGRSAYGCLVDGETICSGYSMAFNIIMRKLGFECGYEFNNYDNFSIIDGHVWNYCKLENVYYYFDLTSQNSIYSSRFLLL